MHSSVPAGDLPQFDVSWTLRQANAVCTCRVVQHGRTGCSSASFAAEYQGYKGAFVKHMTLSGVSKGVWPYGVVTLVTRVGTPMPWLPLYDGSTSKQRSILVAGKHSGAWGHTCTEAQLVH